jgi:hypothetical protein
MSANAAYNAFRSGGGSMRRSTWLKLYAETKAQFSQQADAMTRPLDRRPLAGEMSALRGRVDFGYIQSVQVYVLDKVTGTVQQRWFNVRTDQLMTHGDAIDTALDKFSQATGKEGSFPDDVVLGAAYSGTYIHAPFDE